MTGERKQTADSPRSSTEPTEEQVESEYEPEERADPPDRDFEHLASDWHGWGVGNSQTTGWYGPTKGG